MVLRREAWVGSMSIDIGHYYLSTVAETCPTDVLLNRHGSYPYLPRELRWVYHALFSVIVWFLEEEGQCPILFCFPTQGLSFSLQFKQPCE